MSVVGTSGIIGNVYGSALQFWREKSDVDGR